VVGAAFPGSRWFQLSSNTASTLSRHSHIRVADKGLDQCQREVGLNEWLLHLSAEVPIISVPLVLVFLDVPPSALPHRKAPRLIAKFTKSCPPSRLFALEPLVHSHHRATLSSGGSVDGIKVRTTAPQFAAVVVSPHVHRHVESDVVLPGKL